MKLPFPHPANANVQPPRLHTGRVPAVSPWREEYSLDFRAQTTEDYKASGDGDYTIDGVTWSVTNSANSATFGLVQGTGLEIEPDTSTVFDHATKSAPYLSLALSEVVEDYVPGDRLLVQVAVKAAGLTDSEQAYAVLIGSDQHVDLDDAGAVGCGYDSGEVVRAWRIWPASTTTGDVSASEPGILALEWLPPVFTALYADGPGWPTPGGLTRAQYPSAAFNIGPRATTWPFAPSSVALRVWAQRTGGATPSFTTTLIGLRVLRQRI